METTAHKFKELLSVSGLGGVTLRKLLEKRGIRSLSKDRWGEDAFQLCREVGSLVTTRELLEMSPWKTRDVMARYLKSKGVFQVMPGRWPPEARNLIPSRPLYHGRGPARPEDSDVSMDVGVEETPVPKPQEKPQKKKGRLWRVCVLDDCGWWRVALAGLDLDRAKDNSAEIMSRGKAVMVRPC